MAAKDYSAIDIGNASNVESSLKQKLERLPPLSDERCIFRVPDRLRCINEKAFTPRALSIGPLHHGKEAFKAMEDHKLRYVQDFFQNGEASLSDCVGIVSSNETKLRKFYAEPTDGFSSDEFVEMVLVDAIFIIEIFLTCSGLKVIYNDHVLGTPIMYWDVRDDLCLLENQLPFFVLEDLYRLGYQESHLQELSMVQLTLNFLTESFELPDWDHLDQSSQKLLHMVDLIRLICLGPKQPSCEPDLPTVLPTSIPSAEQLHHAGVKLEPVQSRSLFDVEFKDGILRVPQLTLDASTEFLFRNVLAFEQCHCKPSRIEEWVCFMSYFVSSAKDAELLVHKGIIQGRTRDMEWLSALFKGLAREALTANDFYCATVVKELNAYIEASWHRWFATLKQKYFDNPWSILSLIAAVVLLILTIIQTVCSLVQVV